MRNNKGMNAFGKAEFPELVLPKPINHYKEK